MGVKAGAMLGGAEMTRTVLFLILGLGVAAGSGPAWADGGATLLLAQAATPDAGPAEDAAQSEAEPEAPAAAEPAVEAAPAPRRYFIQLASLKGRETAEAEWRNLVKAHPALLQGLDLTLQPVDLGERGVFHRIQVGPLPNRATARDLCWQLKAKQQDCVVVRRRAGG